jgi:flagellar motor switch protein FliN
MTGKNISNASPGEEPRTVQSIELTQLDAGEKRGARLLGENIDLVRNVRVRLTVSVGQCELTIKNLFELRENAVLTLDKDTREPVDILLDGRVVARGTLVAVDDTFGVQITEIMTA